MKPFKHHKSKNPWYRRVVPADLRDVVGKREIKQSLGPISHAEAVARIIQLDAHWAAEFARLRRERVADVAKLAVEYCDVFFDSISVKGVKHADTAVLVMLRAISDAMVSSWGTRSLNEHRGKEVVG